jgi:hypothetical protein
VVNELFELLHELTHDYPFFGGALAAYIIAFMYFVVSADGALVCAPVLPSADGGYASMVTPVSVAACSRSLHSWAAL